jgi:hypothetical protein
VYGEPHRGFESLPLRHYSLLFSLRMFLAARVRFGGHLWLEFLLIT